MYNKRKKQQSPQPSTAFLSRFSAKLSPLSAIYLKKKLKTDARGCLYIRCSFNGVRSEKSTGIWLSEEQWDSGEQVVSGNPELTQRIWAAKNSFVELLTDGLNYSQQVTGMEPSIKVAAQLVKGKCFIPETILEIFDHEIGRMREKKGEGFSQSNIQKHEISRTHLAEFLWTQLGKKDALFREINKKFIEDLVDFIRTEKGCQHNTTMKHIAIFKKIYKVALDNRWTENNPFVGIKLGLKPVRFEYLTQEELDRISAKVFSTDRLNLVKDYFIFCCYSGLAYIDLMSLKRSNIRDYLSKTWINIHRKKTNVEASVPLMAPARMILEKYQPDWRRLPDNTCLFKKISNQKLNSYLKEVADICGIVKEVHFHMSRHVFATTVTLANNVPIESVSKMLGHSKITMTIKHYARVIDQKISRDMEALSRQLDERFAAGTT
jgi:site-specific recombinase XerD